MTLNTVAIDTLIPLIKREYNPKLIAISGPAEGTTFALTEDETSIGREPANRIRVDDHSVSRSHCLLRREDESFRIVDLESYNGTFVIGVPVGE